MRKNIILAALLIACGVAYAQNDSIVRLENVVITGTCNAADVRHLPMTVTIVGRDKLEESHQSSILPTVMQQVPGVFVTSRAMMGYGVSGGAAGGISIRGLGGGAGQMLVLIDGHPQYQGIYGHPISDSYQTMTAESVEILRGPASVLYGSNAMGGVMNIVTRGMRGNGVINEIDMSAGSYGTFQASATNSVRKGHFSSTASLQYGRSDNHRPNMGFEQYGGYLKFNYDFNEYWNIYMNAGVTHFNASNPGTVNIPLYGADQWITRGLATVAIENHYKNTSGAISVFTNFGRHKIDDGSEKIENPTKRYFRSKDALTGISWYQSSSLFSGNRLTLGVDYQHIYGYAYYTSKSTGEVLDTPNKQSGKSYRNEIAAYADFRQDIAPWLTIDAGIRVDNHSVTGTEWVPQGGVVFRPMITGELKATVSKGFRNPSMREMYLYPPSNTSLSPERLISYELSWKHRVHASTLVYGINIFYINGDNLIETVSINGRPRNVNSGEIENWGVETEASYKVSNRISINTNHSVLHMKKTVIAAPEYKGFLGVAYHNKKWKLQTGLQYVSGLYTNIGANETKENFCLLNVVASREIFNNVSLWLRGDNLLAQRYEINAGFPMPRATFTCGIKWQLFSKNKSI